jgi:sulfatase maturation enzyme AslB (radical SAM superfamily)
VDFFYPFLGSENKIQIAFYGGEPLLAYEQMKHAALLLKEKNKKENKKIEFAVTTNGSLLTEKMLDFFNRHKFVMLLSFDGLAQEKGRKRGTLDQMVQVMKKIQEYPDINVEINSVFSPQTISLLSGSMRFIIEQDGPEITFNLSSMEEWRSSDLETLQKELERLTDFLVLFHKEKGKIPVKNFQGQVPGPGSGIFFCGAGIEHMAVTPEGKLWGCFLFHDYFKTREKSHHNQYQDYYYGTLADFIAHYKIRYPEITANYSELRQDFFQVKDEGRERKFCFLCEDVKGCVVCPVNAAYSSGSLGKISCCKCALTKIQRTALRNFFQKLQQF